MGDGKFLGILQAGKYRPIDEECQGRAVLVAPATCSELKDIILVNENIDIFDSDDILWAMTACMQGGVSITTIPGIRDHQLNPFRTPAYSPSVRGRGISCETISDCTAPRALRPRSERAPSTDVDPRPFTPKYFVQQERNHDQ